MTLTSPLSRDSPSHPIFQFSIRYQLAESLSRKGFVAKLTPTGSGLLFSTFLGDCGLDCDTWGPSSLVIAERQGDLYVAEALGDTTVLWGPVAATSVVVKIHLAGALQ